MRKLSYPNQVPFMRLLVLILCSALAMPFTSLFLKNTTIASPPPCTKCAKPFFA